MIIIRYDNEMLIYGTYLIVTVMNSIEFIAVDVFSSALHLIAIDAKELLVITYLCDCFHFILYIINFI